MLEGRSERGVNNCSRVVLDCSKTKPGVKNVRGQARTRCRYPSAWIACLPSLHSALHLTRVPCRHPPFVRPCPQIVFLDPADPFSAPQVSCKPGVTKQLVVFNGTNCTLWRPDNAAGCFWDASAQAFSGAGCVAAPSGKVECGARGPAAQSTQR